MVATGASGLSTGAAAANNGSQGERHARGSFLLRSTLHTPACAHHERGFARIWIPSAAPNKELGKQSTAASGACRRAQAGEIPARARTAVLSANRSTPTAERTSSRRTQTNSAGTETRYSSSQGCVCGHNARSFRRRRNALPHNARGKRLREGRRREKRNWRLARVVGNNLRADGATESHARGASSSLSTEGEMLASAIHARANMSTHGNREWSRWRRVDMSARRSAYPCANFPRVGEQPCTRERLPFLARDCNRP